MAYDAARERIVLYPCAPELPAVMGYAAHQLTVGCPKACNA